MAWKFPGQAWLFPHADLAAQETDHGDATPASSCVLLPQELGVWAGVGLGGLGACCGGRETAPGMKGLMPSSLRAECSRKARTLGIRGLPLLSYLRGPSPRDWAEPDMGEEPCS